MTRPRGFIYTHNLVVYTHTHTHHRYIIYRRRNPFPRQHQITRRRPEMNAAQKRLLLLLLLLCFPDNFIVCVNNSIYTHVAVVVKPEYIICVCFCRRKSHDLPQFSRRSTWFIIIDIHVMYKGSLTRYA